MTRQLVIEIPGRPPTPNIRRHWRTIARDNATWKATAIKCAGEAKRQWESGHRMPWKPLERATVAATFMVGTKAHRDWDNLVATVKPLLDGIVAAGILLDDSSLVIESFGPFAITHSPRATAVVLTIAEPVE